MSNSRSSSITERLRQHTSWLSRRFIDVVSRFKEQTELRSIIKTVDVTRGILLPKGEYIMIGIDGSMDYDERLEILLFYICASAYRCPITIDDNGIHVNISKTERDSRIALSTGIPLWLEDVSNVLEALPAESDFEFEQRLRSIPFTLMTLGELSIALDALEYKDVLAIFLDRPLFTTFNTSSRDLRLLLKKESALVGFPTSHGRLSMLDIRIASILGAGNLYIPRREPYLVYAAIQVLINASKRSNSNSGADEGIKIETLAKELRLDDKSVEKVVKGLNYLDKRYDGQLLEKCADGYGNYGNTSIRLKDDVRHYWERVMETVVAIRRRIFESTDQHPLYLHDDRWLTLLDLNAINTFLIYELLDKSLERNIMVVGIAKDTSATDLIRSVIPFATYKGVLRGSVQHYNSVKNDKLLLTMMAAMDNNIETPWRTISYDICFTTMISDTRSNLVQGSSSNISPTASQDQHVLFRAARKHIFRERLFIKSYFQLRRFVTDNTVRSPVFVYDRFFNPKVDNQYESLSVLEHRGNVSIEPYFEGTNTNLLDNLILHILSKSDNPEVLEALGHNQLLYLADKAVKAEITSMRGALRGVMDIELDTLARRERIFSASRRFRDIRKESEKRRESKDYHKPR
ncbi:MAG: hypothetical protein ACK4FV_04915 [Candidatus Nitrosocaldus sp.]